MPREITGFYFMPENSLLKIYLEDAEMTFSLKQYSLSSESLVSLTELALKHLPTANMISRRTHFGNIHPPWFKQSVLKSIKESHIYALGNFLSSNGNNSDQALKAQTLLASEAIFLFPSETETALKEIDIINEQERIYAAFAHGFFEANQVSKAQKYLNMAKMHGIEFTWLTSDLIEKMVTSDPEFFSEFKKDLLRKGENPIGQLKLAHLLLENHSKEVFDIVNNALENFQNQEDAYREVSFFVALIYLGEKAYELNLKDLARSIADLSKDFLQTYGMNNYITSKSKNTPELQGLFESAILLVGQFSQFDSKAAFHFAKEIFLYDDFFIALTRLFHHPIYGKNFKKGALKDSICDTLNRTRLLTPDVLKLRHELFPENQTLAKELEKIEENISSEPEIFKKQFHSFIKYLKEAKLEEKALSVVNRAYLLDPETKKSFFKSYILGLSLISPEMALRELREHQGPNDGSILIKILTSWDHKNDS